MAGGREGGGAGGDVGAQLLGKFDSVDQLGGHGGTRVLDKNEIISAPGHSAPLRATHSHILRAAQVRSLSY